MRPRNATEMRVCELSSTLSSLSPSQKRYAIEHCFPHSALYSGRHAHCSLCGHSWEITTNHKTAICPHCGRTLALVHSRKRSLKEEAYFCLVRRAQDFQVFQYFFCVKNFRTGSMPTYSLNLVVEHWLSPRNKTTILARNRVPFSWWHTNPWSMYSPLSIKNFSSYNNRAYYSIAPHAFLCTSILPDLKRFGFRGDTLGFMPCDFFKRLAVPSFETLYKAKWFEAFSTFSFSEMASYWPCLKIAMRHHYRPSEVSLWRDMLEAMQFCGGDIHSPSLICPSDLKASHDLWCSRAERKRAKEAEERRAQELRRHSEEFLQEKGKYLNIEIKGRELTISVLKSVTDYQEEGKAMHHCVFSNNYFLKKDSLILSARDKACNRLATIELSLKDYHILQCRAAFNAVPEKDKAIRSLLNRHIDLFKRASA